MDFFSSSEQSLRSMNPKNFLCDSDLNVLESCFMASEDT